MKHLLQALKFARGSLRQIAGKINEIQSNTSSCQNLLWPAVGPPTKIKLLLSILHVTSVKVSCVLQDAFDMPMVAVSEISKNVVNAMKNCGIAYRTCKTLEDEAIAYVSRSHNWTSEQWHLIPHLCRCRTDSSSVESQYHALYQTSEMLNKTSAKITSVISASQTVIR